MVKIDLTYKTAFFILPSNESKFLSKLADVMIMENFIYDDGEWSNGRIYDPKNGKTYSWVRGKCLVNLARTCPPGANGS